MGAILLVLLMLPVTLIPALFATDLALADWSERNLARAQAQANFALGTAIQKVKDVPTFTGTVKAAGTTQAPDGWWMYVVTGTGSTREIVAIGYFSQGTLNVTRSPLAVRRVHATIYLSDGINGPRWFYKTRQIQDGARIFTVFPISRSTGAMGVLQ